MRNTKFLIKNLSENNFETNDSDITFIKMTEKRQTSQGYIIRILQHFATKLLPWFQRFKINLWLKAAIDSSSRANQFELGSDPDSVS